MRSTEPEPGATWSVSVRQSPQAPPDGVKHVTLSPPRTVVELDPAVLQGQPSRLAWSPDGQEIYLRAVRADRWGNERTWHFVIRVADGRLTPSDAEPAWATAYWLRKSALSAPGLPDFRIVVETRQERKTATGVVSAGSMAQSGGDPTLGAELGPQGQAIVMSGIQAQRVTTTTLRLKGELLGEFVNTPVLPGLTFGWAPSRWNLIAFASTKRRLVLMDRSGRKMEVPGTIAVVLPAWSDDGAHLACLERLKNKTVLVLFDVSAR